MDLLRRSAAILLVGMLLPAPVVGAGADTVHGIAMQGVPKYPADFQHFDYADPTAPKGGALRQSVIGGFDSLHAHIVRGRRAAGLHLPQETLLARSWDEPFSLYGLIARAVELPADRAHVVFHLDPAARWHDGTPVTVNDVLFSWRILRDQGRPNHRSYYAKVAKAAAIGPHAVRFDFKPEPDGRYDREMPLTMGSLSVLSKAWWEGRDFGRTSLEPPLGSGPYRVAAVEPGRRIRYERVPDYWGRDLPVNKGHYNFDTMTYEYYRDDTIALEAFRAGAVDLRREADPQRWASAYAGPALDDGRIVLEALPHGRVDPMRAFIFNTRRPMFADPHVRRALTHAFDAEWINRTLFRDAYRRIESYYPNSELAAHGVPSAAELAVLRPFSDQLPAAVSTEALRLPRTDGSGPRGLRRNLRTATQVLDQAGWRVLDGRRVGPDGQALAFEILLANPADEKLALEFARTLERLGITAAVRTVDSAQFFARLNDFDYDMVLHQWISTLSPGKEQLFYFGSEAADQPGSRNYPGVRSPVVDAIAGALAGTTDRADLVARVRALDRVLLSGWYSVPLFYSGVDTVARWSHIHRPAVNATWGIVLETWWAEPP